MDRPRIESRQHEKYHDEISIFAPGQPQRQCSPKSRRSFYFTMFLFLPLAEALPVQRQTSNIWWPRLRTNGRANTFKNILPSDEAIVSFRERHPQLTVRSAENKSLAKLKGETYRHCNITPLGDLDLINIGLATVGPDALKCFNACTRVPRVRGAHTRAHVSTRVRGRRTHGYCTCRTQVPSAPTAHNVTVQADPQYGSSLQYPGTVVL